MTLRFCNSCAAPLAAPASREQRKTVTVLFCDVTGSTAFGESTDPEALRALLARYFERMKGIVESHGGTVEKFIGDAVMAVFGVPQVHEDDALRACRAAVEMRDALPELGVQARIGVNTGEVVTGTEERLATGDAVNVAARLEQAAATGRDPDRAGDARARPRRGGDRSRRAARAQGKGGASTRLPARHGPSKRRSAGTRCPSSAGQSELKSLQTAWKRALEERRCELVTVVGDAGVGKSRLAAEFLAAVEAPIVGGRCLPYGEGITYWPVVEVVKQLDALPSDPAAAASLRSLLGETEEGTGAEEIAWAFRKLLEERSPLVCVFDDIQWGEETFPRPDRARRAALPRRPDPGSLHGPPGAARAPARWPRDALRLDPLARTDADSLIPAADAGEAARRRSPAAAGGNPLFIERDAGDGRRERGRGRCAADPAGAARRTARPARPGRAAPCSSAVRSKARSSTAARSRPGARGWRT